MTGVRRSYYIFTAVPAFDYKGLIAKPFDSPIEANQSIFLDCLIEIKYQFRNSFSEYYALTICNDSPLCIA